jgi:hypothetical protein
MTKVQTRRTISFRGEIYATLRRHAAKTGEPIAALADRYAREGLSREGAVLVSRTQWLRELEATRAERGVTQLQRDRAVAAEVRAHFTF